MTTGILEFAQRVIVDFPLCSGRVLEVGAQNVNGSIRSVFENASCTEYIGIDLVPGAGVDRVLDAHLIEATWQPETFDTVLCCEMLEHDLMPWITIEQIKRVLKSGGNLFISTPTFGFPEHRYPIDCYRFGKDAYEGFLFGGCTIRRLEHLPEQIICCYGIKNEL